VPFGFDGGPDFFDLGGLANQEGTAHDAHERPAHELLFPPDTVRPDDLVVWIAEQGEIELLLFLKRGLRLDGIGAQPKDDHVELVEFQFCVTELGRFNSSTGSVRFGEKKEQHALAIEIFQRHFLPFVCHETEIGCFGTCFQHSITSSDQPE